MASDMWGERKYLSLFAGKSFPGYKTPKSQCGELQAGVRRARNTRSSFPLFHPRFPFPLTPPPSSLCHSLSPWPVFLYISLFLFIVTGSSRCVPVSRFVLTLTRSEQLRKASEQREVMIPCLLVNFQPDKRRNPGGKKRVVSPSTVAGNLPECNRVGSTVTFSWKGGSQAVWVNERPKGWRRWRGAPPLLHPLQLSLVRIHLHLDTPPYSSSLSLGARC